LAEILMRVLADGRALTKPVSGIGRVAAQTALHSHPDKAHITFACPKPVHAFYQNDPLNVERSRPPTGNWHTTGLQPILQRNQPDVFWGPAHRLPFGLPDSLATVVSVHDLVWKTHPETMRWRTWASEYLQFKRAVLRADKIACVSHSTADDLIRFFPMTENKIRVVHPGASPAQNATQERLIEKPFILFVGTLEPRKNLARLLEAFAALPETLKANFDLAIAGGTGWGGVHIASLIQHHKLDKNTHVFASPNDATLHQLYASCAFLAIPSLYEGFGLPIAEALQYGKPILTSSVSSMPEIAGSAGLYVDPRATDALRQNLRLLMEDVFVRETLAEKAVKEAKRFSWPSSASAMENLFHEAAALKKSRR
jgi:glycosyltransferase involved in cell wall biosynthesis